MHSFFHLYTFLCTFAKTSTTMTIEICVSPALYPYYEGENDTVIIVDILRASTTICVMLKNGASAVIPVAGLDEAEAYKQKGFLVGAERNAQKCAFADFGNSPLDYAAELVSGREVVFTTTNGTQAVQTARKASNLYIGAFSNISALARKCVNDDRIVVVCAGWNNRMNIEDTLFGGAFIAEMQKLRELQITSDASQIAFKLWQSAKENPLEYVKKTEHYARLLKNGVENEAAFCLMQNTAAVVPVYGKATNRLTI